VTLHCPITIRRCEELLALEVFLALAFPSRLEYMMSHCMVSELNRYKWFINCFAFVLYFCLYSYFCGSVYLVTFVLFGRKYETNRHNYFVTKINLRFIESQKSSTLVFQPIHPLGPP
jgi:hypothetical protein